MAKKITDLTELAAVEADDYFVIYEDSSGITKKVKPAAIQTLFGTDGVFNGHADGGMVVSDTLFLTTSAVTVDTWESVGPTGSGADNIWTALDGLPTDIDWIEVRAFLLAIAISSTPDSQALVRVWARKNGSALGTSDEGTELVCVGAYTNDSGHAYQRIVVREKIPVDARSFDIRWFNHYTSMFNDTASSWLELSGYGYNSR